MEEKVVAKAKKYTGILDVLICLLLFIAALYKGEFYIEDSLFINMIICMLGLVCLSIKLVVNIRDNKKITKSKIGTLLDICIILMPIVYFLPIVLKKYASLETAIFECIRYVNLAIIYFIARTSYNKKIYMASIVIIGIVLAILGIDEITFRAFEPLLNKISVYYLDKPYGRISSTLQYANITALFMLIASIIDQSKLVINISKIKDNLKSKIKVVYEIFILLLLQSAVILTTSRMNIFLMVISSMIFSIYLLKKKRKKEALTIFLLLVVSILLVTSIDKYIITQNFFMVIFTYILSFVIICILLFLSCKLKYDNVKSKKENILRIKLKKMFNKKIIRISTYIVCIIILIVIIKTPCKLVISDSDGNSVTVSRNIFLNFKEKMNIDINISTKENSNFKIDLWEYDKDFNRNKIITLTPKDFVSGKYNRDIQISKDTIKLQFKAKVTDSSLTINELKLNNKRIVLSYMFIPDTIIFRLIDTFNKDSNNTLRYTYYKDAFRLFKLSPVFGIGGEGFKARYQEVQTESYISSETHSVPLQILVESGVLGIIVFVTIHVLVYIALIRMIKNNNEYGFVFFLIFLCFNIVSLFDIVFSYGIMINLFAILIGLIIGEYKRSNISDKDKYNLDNKSLLGMTKIVVLSMSLMTLFIVTIYSVNIYRASMFVLPDESYDINISYERVGILENKIKLDKYNASYLTTLLTEYDTHIDLLNDIYINTTDNKTKSLLKNEIDNYIIKQKNIADNLIEYEYYNKYAIEKVARSYFKRYVSYARLYNNNFKNDEIAYVFYVGYAIKLTDRLLSIGPKNDTAIRFAYDIYKEFLPSLEMQNKIIGSRMLGEAIQDIKIKYDSLKLKIN